jgi:GcrA cell cycle regulator
VSGHPPWLEESLRLLREMIAEGATYTQVSEALSKIESRDVSRSAVAGMAKRLGLVSRRAPTGRGRRHSAPPVRTSPPLRAEESSVTIMPLSAEKSPSPAMLLPTEETAATQQTSPPPPAKIVPSPKKLKTSRWGHTHATPHDIVPDPLLVARPKEDAPPAGAISLMDLTTCTCRFPVHGERAPFLFCGAQSAEGRPYCADHCLAAYTGFGRR